MVFEHDNSIVFPTLKQQNLSGGRVYRVENGPNAGMVFPSITTMLAARPKPALEAWKKRVGPQEAARVKSRASVQGSSLHTLTERYLGNLDLPDASLNVLDLWRDLRPWLDKHITKVYSQETSVYSIKLAVAGRFDLLADVDGELAVVDFKSAARAKREEYIIDYFLQGTFYSAAVYEMTGRKPKRIIVPVVSPDGLQVFETGPLTYFNQLLARINEYYAKYAPALLQG